MPTLSDGEARSKRGTPTSFATGERLLAELAALASRDGDRAVRVAVGELARRMNVSDRTVQRHLGCLARTGRVAVEPTARRYTPRRYTVLI